MSTYPGIPAEAVIYPAVYYEAEVDAVLANLRAVISGRRFAVIDLEEERVFALEELGEATTYVEVHTPNASMRVRRDGTSTAYRIVGIEPQ